MHCFIHQVGVEGNNKANPKWKMRQEEPFTLSDVEEKMV